MKRWTLGLVVSAMLAGCGTRYVRVWPQYGNPSAALLTQLNQRLDIDVEDAALDDVIADLRRRGGINIVLMPQVFAQGVPSVTLHLCQVEIGTVLDAMVLQTGLTLMVRDDVIFVSLQPGVNGR